VEKKGGGVNIIDGAIWRAIVHLTYISVLNIVGTAAHNFAAIQQHTTLEKHYIPADWN